MNADYLKPYRLWDYDHEDKTTWAYLDCHVIRNNLGKSVRVVKWIVNPDFKYKHLLRKEFRNV